MTRQRNLAEWPDTKLLEVLTELANVRDETRAARFLQRFPDFLEIKDSGWLLALPGLPHTETASESPVNKSAEYHVILLGRTVQDIWRGQGAAPLLMFLVVDDLTDALQVAIASRTNVADETTKRIMEHLGRVPAKLLQDRLRPDWTRLGRFAYHAATPFQKALYLLWAKSSLVKTCKNPDCPAPFFISRRVQQMYCGDECATPYRLEAKMKWWNSVGKQKREKNYKKTKGKK